MLDQDQVARWVIGKMVGELNEEPAQSFVDGASKAWPPVLAYTKRVVRSQERPAHDATSLAWELWEGVLRSVWRTYQGGRGNARPIADLQKYLIASFQHRLHRRLRVEQDRGNLLQFLPPEELLDLAAAAHADRRAAMRVQQGLELEEIYEALDSRIRPALTARMHGFSWAEVALGCGLKEQTLIMRVQYALRKTRAKLAAAKRQAS